MAVQSVQAGRQPPEFLLNFAASCLAGLSVSLLEPVCDRIAHRCVAKLLQTVRVSTCVFESKMFGVLPPLVQKNMDVELTS